MVEIEIEIGFAFCIESIHVVPKEIGRRSHARAWVQHGQRGGFETFEGSAPAPLLRHGRLENQSRSLEITWPKLRQG